MPSPQNKISSDELSKRERILNAALIEFSQYGFEGSSVRNIGKRAEVDFTLITYYFKTKENLWKAVIERSVREYERLIEEAMRDTETNSPGEKLRAHFGVEMNFAYSDYSIFRLVMNEQHSGSVRGKWIFESFISSRIDSINTLFEEAQAAGEIISGNPFMLSRMMQTALRSMLIYEYEFKSATGLGAHEESVREEFWDLFNSVFFSQVATSHKD